MQQNQNPNKVAATEAPRRVISLLVDNHNGVLARVSSLFCRRGFNIDSLTVGETQDKRHSRMTVVAEGEPEVLEQIEKQLAKLVDVSKIQMLPADASVCRELILIKVAANRRKEHR